MAKRPNRIRLLREQDDLSQEALGRLTGIDPTQISRAERGLRGLPDHAKLALAEHFGVTVSYLMKWDDEGKAAA